MWLLFGLSAAAFYALAELFDNFLSNKRFHHPVTLIFYSYLFNLLFIPILFIYSAPTWPPAETWWLFLLMGLTNIAYLYPYYQALKTDDTSVVIAFFAIGRIFIPILAYFFVGEVLQTQQYLGILLIIIGVVSLGIQHSRKKFRFSKAIWYISLATFLLAFEGLSIKILFNHGLNVSTVVGGESIIGFLAAMTLPFFVKFRHEIRSALPIFILLSPIFLIEELFTFLGQFTESSSISLTSLTIAKGITLTSPFFLLAFAWLGYGVFPTLFREDLARKKVVKKIVLFTVVVVGVLLIRE